MKRDILISAVLALTVVSHGRAKETTGFDCWKLGMSPEAVKACAQRGPYLDVKVTGGLETANGEFDGAKTNISFVFKDEQLVKIQVWLCEQTNDLDEAVTAATRAWLYLSREFGQVRLAETLVPLEVTADEFRAQARAAIASLPSDSQGKFQLGPVIKPEGASVWASVFRDPTHGYYVFLYFAKP